ncbi:MAG: acyltransferase family protein, partial [Thermocrispum sp.]
MRIRADIQGLRAVAVLLVALNHAGVPGLSGGYIGVDVFFVVSGFLITSILLSDHERHGRVSFARFYARRARRILPAASVVLLATLLASWRLLDYVRANDVVGDVVWAAFFGANLRFAAQDTDYFAADLAPSPVQHFWSLAVEEQFYLLWPVLLAVVLVARRRRLLATVLVALCLASLCWSVLQTPADPMSAYFSTLTRGYELGAGALLAVGAGAVARLSTQAKAVLGWSGLAAVLLAATTFGDTTPFPGYHALLPVLGTVAIIAGGLDGRRVDAPAFGAVALLGRRPLRWIGDVSYSLYLWHWPFLILAAGYAGGDLSLGTNLVLLAGAVAASALTFYLVENPFRRARTLAHNPRYALAMWPVAISTVVVAGLVAQASLQSRPASAASLHVDPKDVPKPQRAELKGEGVRDEVATAVNAAALGKPLPSPVEPALADLRDDRRTEAKGCDANVEDTRSDLCPVGDTDADRTMVVLGDSHAAMWLPSIDALAKVRGWQVVPIVKYGC